MDTDAIASLATRLAFHRRRPARQRRLRARRLLPLPLELLQEVGNRPGGRPRGAGARALPRPREGYQPSTLALPRSRERDEGLPLANARKGNQLLPLVFLDRRSCVSSV